MRSMTFLLVAALYGALHAGAAPVDWNSGVPYTYDAAGNIALIGSDHQVYDVAGRLVQSDTNGIRRNFEYDGFGNRTKCLQPGTDCQYGHTVLTATNRLTGLTYDHTGNVTDFEGHHYDYDPLSMPTSRDLTTQYVYTADDERIAVYTAPSATWRWTLRDPSGKVLREMTSRDGTGADELGTTAWALTKDYVWRGEHLLASRQIVAGSATPTTYHYHLDHLGTPRRITDDTDAIVGVHDYHAFGREAPGGTNEPSLSLLKYTGHERDIVGTEGSETLDYMHARYYSATMGRFLSVDPVLDVDRQLVKPQGWNRYSYVENSPLNNRDPDGRIIETVWDIGNVVVDVVSLGTNLYVGNLPGAALDAGGLLLDAAATAVPGLPGGAGAAIKAARLAENAKAGRAFEKLIVQALGASKNTAGVSDIARRITTIPDLPIGKAFGVTDIKHVNSLSLTKQLQAQLSAAKTGKLPFNLIVSANTKTISKSLQREIGATGGKIFVYNEKLQKFSDAVFDGNRLLK